MANRLLTHDEVDALFRRVGLEPPRHAVSDGEAIGARIEPPVVQGREGISDDEWQAAIGNAPRHVQLVPTVAPEAATGMVYTYEAYMALLERYAALKGACHHCWHTPRDWQQGTLQVPVPRVCCWCGASEGPQHGPYAPKG